MPFQVARAAMVGIELCKGLVKQWDGGSGVKAGRGGATNMPKVVDDLCRSVTVAEIGTPLERGKTVLLA